jgi:carboxyl-terminal processing protease
MLTVTLSAQVYDDLAKAWAWEQQVRTECNEAISAEPIDRARVERAIERLRGLLDYFADPRTIALAANDDFRFQPTDIQADLATAYAQLDRIEEAATALTAVCARLDERSAAASLYVFYAERFQRHAHAALQAAPAVAAALRRMTAKDPYARFRARALASPFQPTLSEDQRIAGLSLFWSEVKYNFANFDLVPELDWDAAYLQALGEVRASADTLAFYQSLQRLCAQLRDAHTNVYLPDPLQQRLMARPPLRPMLAEGRVFVGKVRSKQLRELGIAAGQEITQIDGVPVVDYAERTFGPFVSASTPQDRQTRLLVYQLLCGPVDRELRLTLRDPQPPSATREVVVPRKGHDVDAREPDYQLTMHGDIAHVTLGTFEDDAVATRFVADFERIRAARALVLDVRENGGGSSNVGYRILSHLTDKPFFGSRWETAAYRPSFRAWGRAPEAHTGKSEPISPAAGPHFDKSVAVLISARSFSAAEDFAVAFDAMRRGDLIGEPTGGSTGQPLQLRLPGGGSARICTKRDRYPDGREFVGKGVQPTIAVAPTVADVVAGRDTVLERALAELRARR